MTTIVSATRRGVTATAALEQGHSRGSYRDRGLRCRYLGQGHSSLFAWCTQVLHLSEPAAYSRITAARTARRFPVILERLADGSMTLTTLTLLAAHLTDDNHDALLAAARHKSKRDVERLVAALDPQPDIPTSVRKVPAPGSSGELLASPDRPVPFDAVRAPVGEVSERPAQKLGASPGSMPRRSVIAPIAPARYLVKFTVGQETHDKLRRAKDLLRHAIPSGDPAAIVDRALTVLVAELEKTKHAGVRRPRTGTTASSSRHVPAAIKRAVWARDEGRCAFVGTGGRCTATGFLEFHHVVPFAAGGSTSTDNLQLRCRPHNAYEAELYFGEPRSPEPELART